MPGKEVNSRHSRLFALDAWDGKCRICHGETEQRLIGPEQLLKTGQSLYICTDCAGLYMAPDFSAEALHRFYSGAYRRLFVFEAGVKQDAAFYRKNLFAAYGAARAAKLAPLIPHGARVFELGSGCGSFLGAMAKLRPDVQLFAAELDLNIREALLDGAKVTFLEPANMSADMQSGLGGGSGLTPQELLAAGPFAMIVAFHSLEHLRDPSHFLHAAREALTPKGQIMIEVPDGEYPWQAWYYIHPAHLSVFTVNSLSRLGKRCGFEILEAGAHPWGDAFEGYLMMRAGRARPDAVTSPVLPASAEEVNKLYAHAMGYYENWGLKYRFRAFVKNLGVTILGPALVGEPQRAKYRRIMGPRIRQFLKSMDVQFE